MENKEYISFETAEKVGEKLSGAFNPMTKAHLEIIKNILNNMKDEDIDELALELYKRKKK